MGKPKDVIWKKFVLKKAYCMQGEDEDGGGGGSIDEFDCVDKSEDVDGMHDLDIFEAEEVMDESNNYK